MRLDRFGKIVSVGLALSLLATGCSDDDSDDASNETTTTEVAGTTGAGDETEATLALDDADALAAATTYADVVHQAYSDTITAAEELRTSIQALVGTPSEATLAAARQSWVAARALYGPTEAFRFYDGPIDDPDDGPEGQINAWPLDEAYIDYTVDTPDSGIVNDVANVPEITLDVVVAANEEGGETNISTGWHAIEFLLWGQDLSAEGPGARPANDFDTAPNADRRKTYITLLADLLISDLTSVRDQWATDGEYRGEFLADPPKAVENILRGMGALSAGELAGERMAVAYETKLQEDEHSCFSDNTHNDILGNARGIRLAYTADYPGIAGTSLSEVIAKLDPDLDEDLRKQLDNNVAAAESLQAPFDQLILAGDDDPARAELLELIEDLQSQGDAIATMASNLGMQISIEI
ncbi:MAG: iron-regulated protein [Acidimicrobiales bacterium]|nr:iron-regulated protein [Acidimicrobiales bacterium]